MLLENEQLLREMRFRSQAKATYGRRASETMEGLGISWEVIGRF